MCACACGREGTSIMKLNVNDAIEHAKRDIFGILKDVYVSLTIYLGDKKDE